MTFGIADVSGPAPRITCWQRRADPGRALPGVRCATRWSASAPRYASPTRRCRTRLTAAAQPPAVPRSPERRDGSVAAHRAWPRRSCFSTSTRSSRSTTALGHAAGDRLLRVLAERFRDLLRPMDTVARMGGDEFTFLFEGLSGEAEALAIAHRVQGRSQPDRSRSAGPAATPRVVVSIGITMVQDPGVSLDEAIHDADTAMYRAKSMAPACTSTTRARGAGPRSACRSRTGCGPRSTPTSCGRPLPAPGLDQRPDRPGRLRGARSLGTPRARSDRTRGVRPAGRGDRAHPADR